MQSTHVSSPTEPPPRPLLIYSYATFAEDLPVAAAPFSPLCANTDGNQVAAKDGKCPTGSKKLVLVTGGPAQWSPSPTRIRVRLSNPTTAKWGCANCLLKLTTAKGATVLVKGVAHWTWTNGFFYFLPDVGVTPSTFNAAVQSGDTLTVANRDRGKAYKDNLALSLVYGVNNKDRIRVGTSSRDFTVFTVNALRQTVAAGGTLATRQFFCSGDYLGMHARVASLVDQAATQLKNPHKVVGEQVVLFAGAQEVGVALKKNSQCAATPLCVGSTAPDTGLLPLFAVQCGPCVARRPTRNRTCVRIGRRVGRLEEMNVAT